MREKLHKTFQLNRVIFGLIILLFIAIIILISYNLVRANNTITVNEEEIASLKTTITAHETTIKEISDQNKGFKEDIAELSAKIDAEIASNASLEAERAQLEADKTQLESDKAQLSSQKAALEESNGKLQAENGELSKKFKTLSGPS